MPDEHLRRPLSARPPEALETWLREHAAETGHPLNAIITEALTRYRAWITSRTDEHAEEDDQS